MSKGQITLYHSSFRNFGDALSSFLVEYLSGKATTRKEFDTAEMSAVGSVLGKFFLVSCRENVNEAPLKVWGTGMLDDRAPEGNVCKKRGLEVLAVRGKETLGYLRKYGYVSKSLTPAMGDPGLFYPDMIAGCRAKKKIYDLALVPHHMDIAAGRLLSEKLLSYGISVRFVDVTTCDPSLCVLEIASSRKVLSSSLHGLVVADALGIPNRRLLFDGYEQDMARQYGQSNFKFRDYYSAFDLDMPEPLTECMADRAGADVLALINNDDCVPCEKVDECRRALIDAFPYQIVKAPRPFSEAEIARALLSQRINELTSATKEITVSRTADRERFRLREAELKAKLEEAWSKTAKSKEQAVARERALVDKLAVTEEKYAADRERFRLREAELKAKLEEAWSRNKNVMAETQNSIAKTQKRLAALKDECSAVTDERNELRRRVDAIEMVVMKHYCI